MSTEAGGLGHGLRPDAPGDNTQDGSERQRKAVRPIRRVICKFHDGAQIEPRSGLRDELDAVSDGQWPEVFARFPGIELHPLFERPGWRRLNELGARAHEADPSYEAPDFAKYFAWSCPPSSDPDHVADIVNTWPGVKDAYPDLRVAPQEIIAKSNPLFDAQGYLTEVGAPFAWTRKGGTAPTQRLVDIEHGWTLDHVDLVEREIGEPLFGINVPSLRAHGTAVLGVTCAADNDQGGIGVAPELGRVDVFSPIFEIPEGLTETLAVPLAVGIVSLADSAPSSTGPIGGVLLIEEAALDMGWEVPVETVHVNHQLIRLASRNGITVIEPAGNGDGPLDNYEPLPPHVDAGKKILNRNSPDFRESGAILVGASTSARPYAPLDLGARGTNYGSRVDCFSWGENVATCSSDAQGSTTLFTKSFGGTSSAAAIVAGVAACLMGIAEAEGVFLAPEEVRELLGSLGTPQAQGAEKEPIGVMPDLNAIVTNRFPNAALA